MYGANGNDAFQPQSQAPQMHMQHQHPQAQAAPLTYMQQRALQQQAQLLSRLAQLEREKGEATGMVQILEAKLQEVKEDYFDLHADLAATKVEIARESQQRTEELQKKLSSMESTVSFLQENFQNAERTKNRALREVEALQLRQRVEQNRLDAEKRLLANKRRKHESDVMAASQSLMTRLQQSQSQQSPVRGVSSQYTTPPASRRASISTSVAAVQTEPLVDLQDSYAQESAELLSKLMTTSSRDLLTLFNGASGAPASVAAASALDGAEPAAKPPTPTASGLLSSSPHTTGSATTQTIGFSQSVFSQLAGQAQAQAQASLLSFAIESNLSHAAFATERARELYDTLATMLHGDATALALAPVFTKYLAAPDDLDADVLSSVLRLLYFVMHHSERFQRFLLVSSATAASSSASDAASAALSSSGLGLKFASLDEYVAAQTEHTLLAEAPASAERASALKQERAKLLSALCRVVRNYVNQSVVVEHGLCVLSFWVDLSLAAPATQPDFTPLLTGNVIQDIVLAPKSPARTKCHALALLNQLLHVPDMFPVIDATAKKSLLFNRCAQMLATGSTHARESDTGNSARTPGGAAASVGHTGSSAHDMQQLQLQIVHVLLGITWSLPSTGVRFVLDATRGSASDGDGHRSAVYYLVQLLHHETFAQRTMGSASEQQLLQQDNTLHVRLVRDAFTLLGQLARYVDLSAELDGAEHEHALLGVLQLLCSKQFDATGSDSVSKTASALIGMISIS